MVTAGSYLFVTNGLLAAVESENELAFVLAHELGHFHHRDPLQALGRSLVLITLSSLLGLGQEPSEPFSGPRTWPNSAIVVSKKLPPMTMRSR